MSEAARSQLLFNSFVRIGALMPEGMQITFTRDPGAEPTLEVIYPDGRMECARFNLAGAEPLPPQFKV